MELTRAEELDLSRQFGFYVIERDDRLEAVSYFHIARQDNWGMYLILLLALFPIHQMIYNDDLFVRIVCGILGIGIGGFAVLGLLKQMTDSLVVTKERITFRNSLIRRSIPVEKGMEFQMRTDSGVFKRRNRPGYPYFHVEIWMMNGSNEHRIFDFGGHQKERVLLERLGKQLRATINRHIK